MVDLIKNSYVILLLSFIGLCIVFYVCEWGYTISVLNGKPTKKFSWKYPLAISLIIWIIWHFYVYPPAEELINYNQSTDIPGQTPMPKASIASFYAPGDTQKINMQNWT